MTFSRKSAVPGMIVVALALGGSAGCGSDDPTEGGGAPSAAAGGALSADGPRIVLGSGRETFEPVGADGPVPLIRGIQGGFHVWTSFLAYGFDADIVRMELTTRWDDLEDSLLEMMGNVAVRPVTDPSGVPALASLGWPASIFNPACADGQRLELTITVSDTRTGISASDAGRWIVEVADEDRSSDCAP
jgi:hypothetical protein